MVGEDADYVQAKIKGAVAQRFRRLIEQHPEFGFSSLSEFLTRAGLREVERLEGQLAVPPPPVQPPAPAAAPSSGPPAPSSPDDEPVHREGGRSRRRRSPRADPGSSYPVSEAAREQGPPAGTPDAEDAPSNPPPAVTPVPSGWAQKPPAVNAMVRDWKGLSRFVRSKLTGIKQETNDPHTYLLDVVRVGVRLQGETTPERDVAETILAELVRRDVEIRAVVG